MIYFTSDLHLGHSNIITRCQRPFADVNEMNETIIENYNATVGDTDTVYLLGDLCYCIRPREANSLLERLNGRKILLLGNHDKAYNPSLFVETLDFKFIRLDGGISMALMHYPLMEWPSFYQGCYHVHGHIHESRAYNLRNREKGIRRYDVGVDANNFFPVSVDEIIEFFQD